MAHGDIFIILNIIIWSFILFLIIYLFFILGFLPILFKQIRVRIFLYVIYDSIFIIKYIEIFKLFVNIIYIFGNINSFIRLKKKLQIQKMCMYFIHLNKKNIFIKHFNLFI